MKKKRSSQYAYDLFLKFFALTLICIIMVSIIVAAFLTKPVKPTRAELFDKKYSECLALEVMSDEQCSQNAWDYAQSFEAWRVDGE